MEELKSVVKRARYCPARRLKKNEVKDETFMNDIQRDLNLKSNCQYDFFNRYNKCTAPNDINYVSDFMGNEHLNWRAGCTVLLQCSTGMGKTTYIKKLIMQGIRILYLTNRRANRLQMLEAFGMVDSDEGKVLNSKISSYQGLEKNLSMNVSYLNTFDILVMDEGHYFLQDSLFNTKTNLSFKKIMQTNHPRKIFMSATLMDIQWNILSPYMKADDMTRMANIYYYEMLRNKQVIRNIKKMPNDEAMLDEISMSKGKTIIFVDAKEKGKALEEQLKQRSINCIFLCSENSSGSDDASKTYRFIVTHKKFLEKILICTSLLDNGVDIIDEELKTIVLYDNEKIELKQELGRKRPCHANDWIDVLIMDISKQKLANKKKKVLEKIDQMKEYHAMNNYYHRPPASIDEEDSIGKFCRKSFYYDFEQGQFFPNLLGINLLFNQNRDLRELIESDDIFVKKIEWLMDSTNLNIAGSIIGNTDDIKAQLFFKKIKDFLPIRFKKRESSYTEMQALFTKLCFEIIGINKTKGQRSNRMLSFESMKEIIAEYKLPIVFVDDLDGYSILKIKEGEE